jgi:uncharacterized membrane protein YqaE (UPF0057 family)
MVSVIVKKILSGHISLPRSPVFAFGIPRPVIHNISLVQNREKRNLKINIKREIGVVQYLLPVFFFFQGSIWCTIQHIMVTTGLKSGTRYFEPVARKRNRNMELLKIIIVIILPPLGVFLQVGIGKHFWLNLVLTLLGYIPGIVHGVWVIAKNK